MISAARKLQKYRTVILALIFIMPIVLIITGYIYHRKSSKVKRNHEASASFTKLSEKLSQNITPAPTRYDLLQKNLDQYLECKLTQDSVKEVIILNGARRIADDMLFKTRDRFGIDLITFYQTVAIRDIPSLQSARQLISDLENKSASGTSKYNDNLNKAIEAKKIFELVNAEEEIERVDYFLIKFLARNGKTDEAGILAKKAIDNAAKANHLFSKAKLLQMQGDNFGLISKLPEATRSMLEAKKTAENLDVSQFDLQVSCGLSYIYYALNQNQEAFETCFNSLMIDSTTGYLTPRQRVNIHQVIGMSAFNLYYTQVSEQYLTRAVSIAIQDKNQYGAALSYAFLGIIKAETSDHSIANRYFELANEIVKSVNDPATRLQIEFNVSGYQARAHMLAGNNGSALTLYKHTIAIANSAGISDRLPMSRLHQGLGECYTAMGDIESAKKELLIATILNREAIEREESSNDLLTFASTRISPVEQLRMLEKYEQ